MSYVREPSSMLADASSFFIKTPMMDNLHRQIEDWIQCGHIGGLILGEARQGKTTAIGALNKKLTNRAGQCIPLHRVTFGRRDVNSIRAVFSRIAHALKYDVRRNSTADQLQEKISVRLAEDALANDDRKVVLIVDEAQMLTIDQFDAFSEIYNQLFDMKINFVVFFVANQDLFEPLRQTLLSDEYRYLRERFFTNITPYYGIRSEKELKQCLAGYDEYPVTDENDGMTAVAYFCPKLYDQDWRLKDLAPIYWRSYRESYGIPLRHTAWAMHQFIRSTNLLVMDYLPLCTDPSDTAMLEACCLKSLRGAGIEPVLSQVKGGSNFD